MFRTKQSTPRGTRLKSPLTMLAGLTATAVFAIVPAVAANAQTDASATATSGTMTGSSTTADMAVPMIAPSPEAGVNFRILATKDLTYFGIRRAQAYGLTTDQIAEAYALAHAIGEPLNYVVGYVENGATFAVLAQQWGVPIDMVYSPERYRDRINDYLTAYQLTGLQGLRNSDMENANTVATSNNSMTNGTGMGSVGTTEAQASASSTPAPGATSGTSMTTTGQTITDVVRSDGRFTQLASALTAAGLDSYLRGPGPFTLFAPTDAAFAKLPQDQLNALLQNPAQLSKVLQYHLVGRTLAPSDITSMTSPSVNTVEGDPIQVSTTNGTTMVNSATVTQANIQCSNGVIYAVDTVLMPPGTGGTNATSGMSGAAAGTSTTTPSSNQPTPGTTGNMNAPGTPGTPDNSNAAPSATTPATPGTSTDNTTTPATGASGTGTTATPSTTAPTPMSPPDTGANNTTNPATGTTGTGTTATPSTTTPDAGASATSPAPGAAPSATSPTTTAPAATGTPGSTGGATTGTSTDSTGAATGTGAAGTGTAGTGAAQ